MIRTLVLGIGVAFIVGGGVLGSYSGVWPAAGYLAGFGLLIVLGTLFERRYRGAQPGPAAWQTTGERFVDPTTGKLTEVRYDPKTGERAYIPVDERPTSSA